jgi:hypothetical protein
VFGARVRPGALCFVRTAPLGIVLLAPLAIIIFFFHLIITHSYLWGALNLAWLLAWLGISVAALIPSGTTGERKGELFGKLCRPLKLRAVP